MSSKNNDLTNLLKKYTVNSKYKGEAKTYDQYIRSKGVNKKSYYSAIESAIANKEKNLSSYGAVAEKLSDKGISGGYSERLDEITRNNFSDKLADLSTQSAKEDAKMQSGYLDYLEKYAKSQNSIKSKVTEQLFKNDFIDTDAAYSLALASGLSESAAKEVSTTVYSAVRTKIIENILSSVAALTMSPDTAEMVAKDKGLNEDDVKYVKERAEQYYKNAGAGAKDYLDYLEGLGGKTTISFK
jgi:ribosomal protein L4